MSAYSTLYIERSKAKQMLSERIITMGDKELETFMDIILQDNLYNCVVVPDGYHEEFGSDE